MKWSRLIKITDSLLQADVHIYRWERQFAAGGIGLIEQLLQLDNALLQAGRLGRRGNLERRRLGGNRLLGTGQQ